MSVAPAGSTKDRLLAAATELFAERGFHATTARDIAARAGVNLAAGHYHYGSKQDLYIEVLRRQFVEIRAELARRGARPPAANLDRLTRQELAQLLRARAKVMLDLLIGPPPGLHGTLMQREMCDPSAALPVIVAELIQPLQRETQSIIAQLAPGLPRRDVERCAFSIIGQALFYRFAMPAVLRLWEAPGYSPGLAEELAGHITEFSLGGLERVSALRPPRRRAPGALHRAAR